MSESKEIATLTQISVDTITSTAQPKCDYSKGGSLQYHDVSLSSDLSQLVQDGKSRGSGSRILAPVMLLGLKALYF